MRRAVTEGRSIIVAEVTRETIAASINASDHKQAVEEMRPCSLMAIPLKSSGRVIGVITFVSSDSGRHYGQDDLTLAEELGRRAALSVENARLFEEAQQATRARDDMLGIVVHDLRNPVGTILLATELLSHRRDQP